MRGVCALSLLCPARPSSSRFLFLSFFFFLVFLPSSRPPLDPAAPLTDPDEDVRFRASAPWAGSRGAAGTLDGPPPPTSISPDETSEMEISSSDIAPGARRAYNTMPALGNRGCHCCVCISPSSHPEACARYLPRGGPAVHSKLMGPSSWRGRNRTLNRWKRVCSEVLQIHGPEM